MRKRCSKCSLIFLFIVIAVIMTANITYADTPSNWAKAEIDKAIKANLLPEKLQGEYGSNINREEFSEIAVNLYEALSGKKGILQGENPFADTQNSKVRIANSLGIVNGVGDGKFAPYDSITRQEISVMLYRTLQAAKPGNDYTALYNHIFADHGSISSWALKAVGYLYGIEVINGVGGNLFNPGGNTSREQAIVLANRMYEKAFAVQGNSIPSRDGTSREESGTSLTLAKLLAQEMGKPYQWGAEGPDRYDCSGLVYFVYGKLGIALPRVSRDQAKAGAYVSKEDLAYGDLVFFARDGKTVNHVGIYVGNGEFVHAPQTGDVVKKSTLLSGYYERVYFTARRVIN